MTGENANQPPQTKPPKKIVDWDALAPHFRAGTRALKDIGRQFYVSDVAILKHAKKEGWTRKIKAKADAKVAKAAVSKADSKTVLATESAVVEANAPVSRAAVSAEVSATEANSVASVALVSAVVSAVNALDFRLNGPQGIQKPRSGPFCLNGLISRCT